MTCVLYIYRETIRYPEDGKTPQKAQRIDAFLDIHDNHETTKGKGGNESHYAKFHTTRTGKSSAVCSPRVDPRKVYTVSASPVSSQHHSGLQPLWPYFWTLVYLYLQSVLLSSSSSYWSEFHLGASQFGQFNCYVKLNPSKSAPLTSMTSLNLEPFIKYNF